MPNRIAVLSLAVGISLLSVACQRHEPSAALADTTSESISAFLVKAPFRDSDRAAEELAGLLLSASEKEHAPDKAIAARLARSLVTGLGGTNVPLPVASKIEKSILNVLHSAGTSTSEFKATLKEFESSLGDVKVAAVYQKEAADLLEALGRKIRGPDDTPF